ncbi:MAG: proteasome assembly chaperone family protein [Candidatus Hadarchaeia archaeon]
MNIEIKIIEKEKPKKESTVILAFPDVGLVGPIAVKHLIKDLEMEEIGYITSDTFPPITAVHNSRPTYPIRIYGKSDLISVTSEIPITPDLINPFSNEITGWLEKIKAKNIVILGGLPRQNREEIDEPPIHGIPSNKDAEVKLKDNDLHVLEEGFISGINGVLLRSLAERNVPGIYLMSEAHRNYPDPGAAASILEALNDLEGLSINVDELRKKEEEIKVAARDLMRQTQKTMQEAEKNREEEIPMMYG